MKSNYVTVALALGLGVAVGYIVRDHSKADRELSAQVAKLDSRMRVLERERESTSVSVDKSLANVMRVAVASERVAAEAVARLQAPPVAEASPEGEAKPSEGATVDRSPAAQQARIDAYLKSLDKVLDAASSDPAWSASTLREAGRTLASKAPGSRIVEERCGGDMCRLVLEGPPNGEGSLDEHELLGLPPFDHGSTVARIPSSGDGTERLQIYLKRPIVAANQGP